MTQARTVSEILEELEAAQEKASKFMGEWQFYPLSGDIWKHDPPQQRICENAKPEAAEFILRLLGAYPALREEIERLKSAVERLGSMEAFTVAHMVENGTDGRELIARVEFARRTLKGDEDNG